MLENRDRVGESYLHTLASFPRSLLHFRQLNRLIYFHRCHCAPPAQDFTTPGAEKQHVGLPIRGPTLHGVTLSTG